MGEENKATEMVVCLDGKPVGICEEIPTLTELEPVAGAETIAGGTVTEAGGGNENDPRRL